jgi:plastocyanin
MATSTREIPNSAGRLRLVACLTALLLLSPEVWAANYTVQMTSGDRFSPSTLSIGLGDSVTWTNTAIFAHTSTSGSPAPTANGLWDTGHVAGAGSFTVTYTNFAGGTYPFFCSIHYAIGMTGSLTITNAPENHPLLTDSSWNTNHFQFIVNGPRGQTYVIEASPDLANWSAVGTNLATSSRFTIIETNASNPFGFYRVRLGP